MAVSPIEMLTPTLAWQLRSCPHAVGLRQPYDAVQGQQRRNPPPAALGKAAHSVLEHAFTDVGLDEDLPNGWFDETWDAAVRHERTSCTDTGPPQTWRRFSIVKRGTRRAVTELRALALASGAQPIVEKEKTWAEGKLAGRPDLIFAYQDGSAEVVDFKTGSDAGGEPPESELHQLSLYAVLVRAVYGLTTKTLRVVRCEGVGWSRSVTERDVDLVYRDVLQRLEAFNRNFSNTEPLATPGAPCAHCRQVLDCDVVWSVRPDSLTVVDGLLSSVEDEAGALSLAVQTDVGQLLVVGCPNRPVKVGDSVRIAHLRKVSEGAFRWQPDRTQMSWK